jgi:hypothetical protein
MTVLLSPVGGVAAQFFDNNGNPLSGGKLFSYAAGTTTPAATYTSSLGVTAHTNPIVLDAGGRVPGGEIWLTDGIIYKFVLETSTNVLIATYDNIVGINSNFVNYTTEQEIQTATAGQTVFDLTTTQYQPGTNSLTVYVDGVNQYGPGAQFAYLETDSDTVTFVSGLHVGASVKFTTATQTTGNATDASVVAYNPPFAGAVATNVEDKLAQYVSVQDFGAVGDGVADDTAAIQAALDTNVNVYFPFGTYKISETLTQSAPIYSDGATIDVDISDATTYPFAIDSGADISGLTFDGTNSVTGVSAINMTASGKLTKTCRFNNFFGYAYKSPSGVTNNTLSQSTVDLCGRGTGGSNIEAVYVHSGGIVESCQVTNSRYKAIISGTGADNVRFVGNVVDTTTNVSEGLYFSEDTTDSIMIGNRVRGIEVGVAAVKITRGTTRCQIANNYIEINGVLSQGGTDNVIAENNIIGAIAVTAHFDGTSFLAETGTKILNNNVSDYIELGLSGAGDVNGIICKGNVCGGLIKTTGSSLYFCELDSNQCVGMSLQIDPAESASTAGPLTITNNTILFSTGTALLARGVDSGAGLQAPQVVIVGNYIRGPGSATAATIGIKSLGVVLTTIENNVIEQSETGLEVSRLGTSPRLRIRNNSANADVTTGYSFPDSDSATYWAGTDFVIENNIGTYTAVASSRPFFYPSQENLYAAAAPTTGYHQVGEYRINSAPTSGGSWGFVCTTAGTPGTWKTYGTIS